jgi:hypothetical protein
MPQSPSPSSLEQVRQALETALTGLQWYRDRCPDAVDGSDDEADEEIRAALSAVEALAGQQAEPVLGEVWMAFGRLDDGRLVALPEYAAVSEREVGSKIMDAARREGFRGLLAERLNALGWTVRRVSPAALQQQEAGSGPTSAQMMAGYEVACRFGVLEKRAFDLAEQMFQAMSACAPSPTEPKAAEGVKEGGRG